MDMPPCDAVALMSRNRSTMSPSLRRHATLCSRISKLPLRPRAPLKHRYSLVTQHSWRGYWCRTMHIGFYSWAKAIHLPPW